MNGDQLRTARTELGWTRPQLAEATGLTVYKIHQIETCKRPATDEEVTALKEVLLDQLNEVLTTGETAAILDEPADDVIRSTEWNGLRRGDEVLVKGMKGVFHFLYYHQDATQEYVEVYGPAHKPKERSLDPQLVRAAHRK